MISPPSGISAAIIFCFAFAGLGLASDGRDTPAPRTIPFDQLGAEAQKQYQGEDISITPTSTGARLRAVMQDLEGEATPEGMWLTSTAAEDAGKSNRFRIRASELGRTSSLPLAPSGTVHATKDCAALVRPGLLEEYRVSTDGVRQDFVVLQRPGGSNGPLRLTLDIKGASAETASYGVKLAIDATGRELAYSRLHVTDASDRELTARMIVDSQHRLRIEVDDSAATYPVRIDPTFSDADWVSMGGLRGANLPVSAVAVDPGGNLYLGGSFTAVGNIFANRVAKWNGSEWSALGSGVNNPVHALAWQGGSLYAGGFFTLAGGAAIANVAKWDGTTWSSLGTGVNGTVRCFASTASGLYVGGDFTMAGGSAANRVARWDGTSWSALGSGIDDGGVESIAIVGPWGDVYVGGSFVRANSGTLVRGVARWDGLLWRGLGEGMGGVNAVVEFNNQIYVGGHFSAAFNSPTDVVLVNNIARWNGFKWSPVKGGVDGPIWTMAATSSRLFVGGEFTHADETKVANRVAAWNGTDWVPMGAGMDGVVSAMAVDGDTVYAAGNFRKAGGVSAQNIARFTGSAWSQLGTGMGDIVHTLAVAGNDLYVGGDFVGFGNTMAKHVVKWNGSSWSELGAGLSGSSTIPTAEVFALAASGDHVYAAGNFTFSGSTPVRFIAKWDGTAWTPLGTGLSGTALTLAVSGNNVYAGGTFLTAGGVVVNGIARWDGTKWFALGSGMDNDVKALLAVGSDLYAGGYFTTAGGVPVNRIARWDGSIWSPLGSGMDQAVLALARQGTDIIAAGEFGSAGDSAGFFIARWDGNTWSSLGSGLGFPVYALTVSGVNVYAGGAFFSASGVSAIRIARWNGNSWSRLGTGLNGGNVRALAMVGTDLYVGGEFLTAGPVVSPYLARANLAAYSPIVQLGGISAITGTSATASGTVNPKGEITSAYFEYGTTTAYGSIVPVTLSPNNGTSVQAVGAPLTGLAPGTPYHYRLTAASIGTSFSTSGTFTTLSNNTNLSGLVISPGTLTPAFKSATTTYATSIPFRSLTVTPTVTHPGATVTVNGNPVTSGSASPSIDLVVGLNPISIVVTAEDNVTTKTYILSVTRVLSAGTVAIGLPASSTIRVDEEAGVVNIPITRSGGVDGSVGFTIAPTSGTAALGSDFLAPITPQVMDDGVASISVPVTILDPVATNESEESFTITISAPTGGATLGAVKTVTVRIIDSVDTVAPIAPFIVAPAANAVLDLNGGAAISVSGTAADNKRVASVKVRLNGGGLESAIVTPSSSHDTSWTHSVTPAGGANLITVQTFDAAGNSSAIMTRTITVRRLLGVNIVGGSGTVTSGFTPSPTFREVGKSYTISATPAAGFIFTHWTATGVPMSQVGLVTSALQKQSLTFIFREGLVLTANFAANPYGPSVTGTYTGLVKASPDFPDRPSGADGSVAGLGTEGYLAVTVMNTGAFSGKLSIDGFVLNVAGIFDHQGCARFGTTRVDTLTVPRAGKPSLVVKLDIGGPSGSAAPVGQITGTVTALEFLKGTDASVSNVTARRAHFTGLAGAVVPDEYLTVTGTASSPAGRTDGVFTIALPSVPIASQPVRVSGVLTEQDYPRGDGIGTLRITKAGAVTLTATLADGTALTAAGSLSHDLHAALFAQIYAFKGFLSAPIQLNQAEPDSDLKMANGGEVLWCRPFNSASHYYPYGWRETIELDLLGARYVAVAGQNAFKAPDGADIGQAGDPLQTPDADGNVTLTFNGGHLLEATIKSANLNSADSVTKVPDNDPTFTMIVSRTTGTITGVFDHIDDTKPAYNAIIFQKGPNAGARGFFLTKQPTPIDYTGESGRVLIQGAP